MGFGVQGSEFRVQGSGSRVRDAGIRIQGEVYGDGIGLTGVPRPLGQGSRFEV